MKKRKQPPHADETSCQLPCAGRIGGDREPSSDGVLARAAHGGARGARGPWLLPLKQLGDDARRRVERLLATHPAEVDATLRAALHAIEDDIVVDTARKEIGDRAREIATRIALVALAVATVKARVSTAGRTTHRRGPGAASSRLKPLAKVEPPDRLTLLANEVANGSLEKLPLLMDEARPMVRDRLRQGVPDRDLPDVVQRTMNCVARALSAGTNVRRFTPWIFTIAHNERARYYARYLKKTEELDENAPDETPSSADPLLERRLEQAFAMLPANEQHAFLQSVRGVTQRAIAKELGVSHAQVFYLVERAEDRLRKLLADVDPRDV